MKRHTTLPVEIPTGFEHEHEIERARQQIEKTSVYLQSLFNLIKLSAHSFEVINKKDVGEYLEDLTQVSELGRGIAASLFDSILVFEDVEKDIQESNRVINDAPIESENFGTLEEADTDTLALALSEVLRNENLPTGIYDALQDALNDAYNGGIPQVIRDYETSPEYLKAVFESYRTKHSETDE
jgi:hypothetical protein